MKKNYYNEELEKMLNRYIKEEKYGGFKPLLNEIFQRRAYEFQFNEKQMKKQIKNFVRRTEKIGFGKNIKKINRNTNACLRRFKGKGYIWLNCEANKYKANDIDWLILYEELTHEVYHAIAYGGKCIGLYNIKTENGTIEDEIINETAAIRTSFLRTSKDNENFRKETNGYSEMTFVANLLAASFGIEERELLKGGIQNRKEFEKACQKYLSKEDYENDVSFHYDILKGNLDFLYNVLYGEEENEMDLQVLKESLTEIYSQIYEIASVNVTKSTREITQEYAEELAYHFQKICTIMTKSLKDIGKRFLLRESTVNEIFEKAVENSLGYLYKVSDVIALTNRESQIKNPAVWEEMSKLAKQGELIENAEKFGMEVGKNLTSRYKLIQYHKKTNHEFENPTQWDNQDVMEIIEQLWNEREVIDVAEFEQKLRDKTIRQKIKDYIMQFKNRNLKKLEDPKSKFKELKNNLDEKYKVSPENLKPMENGKNTRKHSKESGKEEKM